MINSKAYTQVYYIIQNMSEDLRKKIPKELINIVEKNMDNKYKIDNIEKLDLLEDTQKILSVIYTDYIATNEERLIIKNKEKIINSTIEEEKRSIYDINIFKEEKKNNSLNKKSDLEITVVKKEKWYIKIIRKLKLYIK